MSASPDWHLAVSLIGFGNMDAANAERVFDAGHLTTALMEKDIDLVRGAVEQAGVELPLANALKALLHSTIDTGYADDDFISLFLQLSSGSDRNAGSARALQLDDYAEQEVVR